MQVTELKSGEDGECLGHRGLIRISKKLTKKQAEQTLFHEMLHAALYLSGHSQLLGRDDEEGQQEEALVLMFEHAFADMIDVNKSKV